MKTITFAAIAVMALGLCSCERYVYTVRDETTEEVRWYSGEFTLEHWIECCDADGLNRYYKADVSIPRLNSKTIRNGQINCYLYVGQDIQAPLPYVRHFENYQGQRWTCTVDFEYYSGGITIYVTDNDFAGDVPEPMSFRIALSW